MKRMCQTLNGLVRTDRESNSLAVRIEGHILKQTIEFREGRVRVETISYCLLSKRRLEPEVVPTMPASSSTVREFLLVEERVLTTLECANNLSPFFSTAVMHELELQRYPRCSP